MNETAIREYVAVLQEAMSLQNWRLTLTFEKPTLTTSPYIVAQMDMLPEAHECLLRINRKRCRRLTRRNQRQVLVHELCHLILFPAMHAQDHLYRVRHKSGGGAGLMSDIWEQVNDDFAMRIADHLPLPPRGMF